MKRGFRFGAWGLLLALHLLIGAIFSLDRTPGTDAAATGFPLDDAWIHLVYGRELALHGAPYYNTGELEAGFTSPTWIMVTGFAELARRFTGFSAVTSVKALGVASSAAASILLFELMLALGAGGFAALATAGLSAAHPKTAFAQLSGMEVGLAAALLIAALLALARRRHVAAGVIAGLAYLTRPECAVAVPLLAVGLVFEERRLRSAPGVMARGLIRLILPFAIAAGAWAAYCLAASGHLLPNTFYAKYGSGDPLGSLGRIVVEFLGKDPLVHGAGGVLLYLLGVGALLRSGPRSAWAVIALPWIFFAAVALTRPLPEGSVAYFYYWRYLLPALPILLVPLGCGVNAIWRAAGALLDRCRPQQQAFLKPATAATIGMLFAAPLFGYPAEINAQKRQFSWNCQNINEFQVSFGIWVNENVPRGAAVGVHDAGAIRYFGERRTLDFLGLNNHSFLFQGIPRSNFNRDPGQLARFLREHGASHFIVFPSWYHWLVASPTFPRYFDAVAMLQRSQYTIDSPAQNLMIAYRLR